MENQLANKMETWIIHGFGISNSTDPNSPSWVILHYLQTFRPQVGITCRLEPLGLGLCGCLGFHRSSTAGRRVLCGFAA